MFPLLTLKKQMPAEASFIYFYKRGIFLKEIYIYARWYLELPNYPRLTCKVKVKMDSRRKQIKEELAWDSHAQRANNLIQSIRVLTLL